MTTLEELGDISELDKDEVRSLMDAKIHEASPYSPMLAEDIAYICTKRLEELVYIEQVHEPPAQADLAA